MTCKSLTVPFRGLTFEMKFSGYGSGALPEAFLSDVQGPVVVASIPIRYPMNFPRRAVRMTSEVEINLLAGQSVTQTLLRNGAATAASITIEGPYTARTPSAPLDISEPFDVGAQYDVQVTSKGLAEQGPFGAVTTIAWTVDPNDSLIVCKTCC